MKVGTTELVKFLKLKRALGLSHFATVGLLESTWMFALKNAPRGDIGRHSNEDIACMIEWDGDPDELIDALVKYQWFDRHPDYRLVIHDWSDHAPKWLKGNVASHGKQFADTPAPAKQRAEQPARPAAQAATKSCHVSLSKSSPPPSATDRSSKPEPAGDADQWVEMEERLISSGVSDWRGLRGSFRGTGCSAQHGLALIKFWTEHQDGFDSPVGALHHRLKNAHPSIPVGDGWPGLKPTVKPKSVSLEIEVAKWNCPWGLLRKDRRHQIANQAGVDLGALDDHALDQLPPELKKPILALLARQPQLAT